MFRARLVSLVAVSIVATAGYVSAQETPLRAFLSNDAEVHDVVPTTSTGDPRPASFGNATFTLNEDMTELSFTAEIFNIDVTGTQTPDPNDDLTNAHIHAGPDVTPSTTGGVVWGFHGSPFNNTDPDDSVFEPFTTGVGGTFSGTWNMSEGQNTTLTEQLSNILEGRAYINFHTAQFGPGEIRGNIFVVPEPTSLALAVSGGLLAILWSRRKRVG